MNQNPSTNINGNGMELLIQNIAKANFVNIITSGKRSPRRSKILGESLILQKCYFIRIHGYISVAVNRN